MSRGQILVALRAMTVRDSRERMLAALMIVMATRTLLVSVRIFHARMVGRAGVALGTRQVVPAGVRAEDRERVGEEIAGGMRLVAGFAVGVEGGVRVGEVAVRVGRDGPRGQCEFDEEPAEGEPSAASATPFFHRRRGSARWK